ncbi:MAG: hypothetical protein HZC10_09150 [Nitrospirae bacterium]|nr:hypothetical protein [Nitrospirota bacterium]
MVTKSEKLVISFVLLLVFILNISVPVVYAIERAKEKTEPLPYCSLFCNLSPSMAKNNEKVSCPHHLREIKKNRLTDHFQCRIGTADCHDNTSKAQASSFGDPYLLSKYPLNQNISVSFLDFNYLTISSQTVILFLERPPSKLHS